MALQALLREPPPGALFLEIASRSFDLARPDALRLPPALRDALQRALSEAREWPPEAAVEKLMAALNDTPPQHRTNLLPLLHVVALGDPAQPPLPLASALGPALYKLLVRMLPREAVQTAPLVAVKALLQAWERGPVLARNQVENAFKYVEQLEQLVQRPPVPVGEARSRRGRGPTPAPAAAAATAAVTAVAAAAAAAAAAAPAAHEAANGAAGAADAEADDKEFVERQRQQQKRKRVDRTYRPADEPPSAAFDEAWAAMLRTAPPAAPAAFWAAWTEGEPGWRPDVPP
jgi:hypothetical protein